MSMSAAAPRHAIGALVLPAILAAVAPAARAFTLSGQWSYDPAAQTFTLPGTPSPAEFEQYLLQAFPLYDAGDQLAAALTGDAVVAVNSITYRVYDNPDGGDPFGELGADIIFNPIATGAPAIIDTGGDFHDRHISSQKEENELATVEAEKEVFRQDFGQVQATKRGSARDTLDDIFISFRGPVSIPTGALDVDANGLTAPFEVTIGVVPSAPSGALLLPATALLARRRRS